MSSYHCVLTTLSSAEVVQNGRPTQGETAEDQATPLYKEPNLVWWLVRCSLVPCRLECPVWAPKQNDAVWPGTVLVTRQSSPPPPRATAIIWHAVRTFGCGPSMAYGDKSRTDLNLGNERLIWMAKWSTAWLPQNQFSRSPHCFSSYFIQIGWKL
jgi:hypothetical protein